MGNYAYSYIEISEMFTLKRIKLMKKGGENTALAITLVHIMSENKILVLQKIPGLSMLGTVVSCDAYRHINRM